MSHKIIFFDVDGTLYDHVHNCIPDLHMKALYELKEKGYKICLCTGRSKHLIDNLGIQNAFEWDGIVGGNGSTVYDKNWNVIYENVISDRSAAIVLKRSLEKNIPLLCCGNTVFVTQKTDYMNFVLDKVHIQCDIKDYIDPGEHFTILTLCVSDFAKYEHMFDDLDDIKPIVTRISLDLMKEGNNKYKGIQILMDHFGYHDNDYIAFGDEVNDLEMLKHATLGVAMGNGNDFLKEQLHEICPPVTDGGIYYYLKDKGIL